MGIKGNFKTSLLSLFFASLLAGSCLADMYIFSSDNPLPFNAVNSEEAFISEMLSGRYSDWQVISTCKPLKDGRLFVRPGYTFTVEQRMEIGGSKICICEFDEGPKDLSCPGGYDAVHMQLDLDDLSKYYDDQKELEATITASEMGVERALAAAAIRDNPELLYSPNKFCQFFMLLERLLNSGNSGRDAIRRAAEKARAGHTYRGEIDRTVMRTDYAGKKPLESMRLLHTESN